MSSLSVVVTEVALVILSMTQTISARPSQLLARDAENFVGCSDDQISKIKTALADAAALGNIAYQQMSADRSGTAYAFLFTLGQSNC